MRDVGTLHIPPWDSKRHGVRGGAAAPPADQLAADGEPSAREMGSPLSGGAEEPQSGPKASLSSRRKKREPRTRARAASLGSGICRGHPGASCSPRLRPLSSPVLPGWLAGVFSSFLAFGIASSDLKDSGQNHWITPPRVLFSQFLSALESHRPSREVVT